MGACHTQKQSSETSQQEGKDNVKDKDNDNYNDKNINKDGYESTQHTQHNTHKDGIFE